MSSPSDPTRSTAPNFFVAHVARTAAQTAPGVNDMALATTDNQAQTD
jgi:hypothetical protein